MKLVPVYGLLPPNDSEYRFRRKYFTMAESKAIELDLPEAWNRCLTWEIEVSQEFLGIDMLPGSFLNHNQVTEDEKYFSIKSVFGSKKIKKRKLLNMLGIDDAAIESEIKGRLFVTCDPRWIYNCSNDRDNISTFDSCFRPGGMHHRSAWHYMTLKYVFMAMILTPDLKRIYGRHWIMFPVDNNDARPAMLFTKYYGMFPNRYKNALISALNDELYQGGLKPAQPSAFRHGELMVEGAFRSIWFDNWDIAFSTDDNRRNLWLYHFDIDEVYDYIDNRRVSHSDDSGAEYFSDEYEWARNHYSEEFGDYPHDNDYDDEEDDE